MLLGYTCLVTILKPWH